jgi:TRAP-type uncharacterized transport system substrate-binding protein
MLKKALKYGAIVLVVLVPVLLRWAYLAYTSLPAKITIATGPAGGQWDQLSRSLQNHVEAATGIQVKPIAEHTGGALQHLELLSERKVDFALYMRGAQRMDPEVSVEHAPSFVCNLYSDMTLFLVRREVHESGRVRSLADLQPSSSDAEPLRIAVGREQMGEYRLSQAIMSYYFGEKWQQLSWLEPVQWDYMQTNGSATTPRL